MHRNRIAVFAGGTAAGLLSAIAGLHVFWAAGGTWPASDKAELARAFGFTAETLPPPPAVLAVAALLAAAAALVAARAGLVRLPVPRWIIRTGTWTVAGVLLLRGLMGLSSVGAADTPSLELTVYTPVALLLGALTAVAARARARTVA